MKLIGFLNPIIFSNNGDIIRKIDKIIYENFGVEFHLLEFAGCDSETSPILRQKGSRKAEFYPSPQKNFIYYYFSNNQAFRVSNPLS